MAVYFSNACAEMVFISQLLTGVRDPVYLAGPLLADVYVTLLKGRNAWYGEQVALGNVNPENGPYVPGILPRLGVQLTPEVCQSCFLADLCSAISNTTINNRQGPN